MPLQERGEDTRGEGSGFVIGVVTDQASGIILLCVNRAVHHDPAEGAGHLVVAAVVADQATGIVSLRFDDAHVAVFVSDGIAEHHGIHLAHRLLGLADQTTCVGIVGVGKEIIGGADALELERSVVRLPDQAADTLVALHFGGILAIGQGDVCPVSRSDQAADTISFRVDTSRHMDVFQRDMSRSEACQKAAVVHHLSDVRPFEGQVGDSRIVQQLTEETDPGILVGIFRSDVVEVRQGVAFAIVMPGEGIGGPVASAVRLAIIRHLEVA